MHFLTASVSERTFVAAHHTERGWIGGAGGPLAEARGKDTNVSQQMLVGHDPDDATLPTMRQDWSEKLQEEPLAYFITFRCYGTWLPGDARGWIDRPRQLLDSPLRSGHPGLHATAQAAMSESPFVLGSAHRAAVDASIRDVCAHRGWTLHALNVRTNHVHLVVSAKSTPEQVMTALKAWSTRHLREGGLVAEGFKPWSRHGSTRYLWRIDQIEAACSYVLDAQGKDLT